MVKERTILFFLTGLNGGGAEKVMITIANFLASAGVRVIFVVVSRGGVYAGLLSPEVEFMTLRTNNKLLAIFELAWKIKEIKPTCVISSILGPNIILALANMLAGSKAKLVLREANTPSMEASQGSLKQKVMRRVSKPFYPKADVVITVSKAVELDVKNYYGQGISCETIYNPVNVNEIHELALQVPAKWHPWDDDAAIIISAGRLSRQKDYATLLRALHSVLKVKDCKLIILGEGELRSELEDMIRSLRLESHVWLPGFVDNPFPYFKAAQVFVLSSRWEGMPNVLIHALAMGLRVVSTDCPSGPKEITDNGRFGYLVEVGGVEAMKHAIVSCLEAKESREEKAIVDQYIKESFDMTMICKAYQKILTTS